MTTVMAKDILLLLLLYRTSFLARTSALISCVEAMEADGFFTDIYTRLGVGAALQCSLCHLRPQPSASEACHPTCTCTLRFGYRLCRERIMVTLITNRKVDGLDDLRT